MPKPRSAEGNFGAQQRAVGEGEAAGTCWEVFPRSPFLHITWIRDLSLEVLNTGRGRDSCFTGLIQACEPGPCSESSSRDVSLLVYITEILGS